MNIFSKAAKPIICLTIIGCIMLGLSGCSKFARRKPFTASEMEKYMEKTYDEEFTVLSRKEVYDTYTNALKYVDYEILYNETDIIFEARDMYDGAFAVFGVYDEFEKTVGSHND